MRDALIAVCFQIWTAIHPLAPRTPDARPIAEATVDAVLADAAAGLPPVLGSYPEDVAVQAYWAFRESNLHHSAVGDGGRSFGAWQMRGPYCGQGATIRTQARCWRHLAREGLRMCRSAPLAIMWGGCRLPIAGFPGATSASAAELRVGHADHLLRLALGLADETTGDGADQR